MFGPSRPDDIGARIFKRCPTHRLVLYLLFARSRNKFSWLTQKGAPSFWQGVSLAIVRLLPCYINRACAESEACFTRDTWYFGHDARTNAVAFVWQVVNSKDVPCGGGSGQNSIPQPLCGLFSDAGSIYGHRDIKLPYDVARSDNFIPLKNLRCSSTPSATLCF